MSLCPHYLRSRFSSGLQFCAPRHRISLGHWHRPRTQTKAARYVVGNARYSNTGGSGVGRVDNGLETSAMPPSKIVKNVSETGSSDASIFLDQSQLDPSVPMPPHLHTESLGQQPGTFSANPASPQYIPLHDRGLLGNRITPALSESIVKKILGTENYPLSLSMAVDRINSETMYLDRRVSLKNLALEAGIRATTLYSRGVVSENWYSSFRVLYAAKRDKTPLDTPMPSLLDGAWPLIEMINTDCFRTFQKTWAILDKPAKAAHWQRLAFWLLQYSPLSMPGFLFVTMQSKHRPNCNMVADCLVYLNKFYPDQIKGWRKGSLTYTGVIQTCLSPQTWPTLAVPQIAVRTYVKHTGYGGICYALTEVENRQIHLSSPSVLSLVNRFVEFQDAERALAALQHIPILNEPGFGLDSTAVLRHCCKLLTLDSVVDAPTGRNFRILPKLLKMGVQPDRDMMNVILSNAFKTGDPQLGLDMLDFMKSQGHELDTYTYCTLLTDAVSRGDRERVVTLMHEIEGRPQIRENQYIMSKLIHAHYVFTAKKVDVDEEPTRVFYAMLDIYNRLHDITPLKELSIIPPEYTPPVPGANHPPSLMALYILIATYFRCQKRLSNIERVYSRFRSLALKGHATISPLTATDHTYNEFLVALRHNPHGLRLCVRVLEDMMQAPAEIKVDTEPEETIISHARPTVRSWTVLLSAFIYNKQPFAAEKVKEMMAKHKIKFNQVVWNTVISGYANSQNIPETAKAIRMMEHQGFSVDAYTLRSLHYLNNPDRLWVVLDELDKVHDMRQRPNLTTPLQQGTEAEEDEDSIREYEDLLDQGMRRLEEKKRGRL